MATFKPAFVCNYFGGFEEEAAVLQVHHLPLQLVLHHIHQSQFIRQVLRGEEGQRHNGFPPTHKQQNAPAQQPLLSRLSALQKKPTQATPALSVR